MLKMSKVHNYKKRKRYFTMLTREQKETMLNQILELMTAIAYDEPVENAPAPAEKKTNPFYLSKQWIDKREKIKRKCFGLDVYDLIVNHTVTYGRIVHHIVPLNDNEQLKLSDSNLIFLSDTNHQLIHKMLERNYDYTINMLTECLKKFEEIFGTGGI